MEPSEKDAAMLVIIGVGMFLIGACLVVSWFLPSVTSHKFATGSDFPIGESLRQAGTSENRVIYLPDTSGYILTSPYMIASGDRIDFLTDQNGTKVIVGTLEWAGGVVRYEGPTDGPARVFMEALSGLIEQECQKHSNKKGSQP